MRRRYHYRPRSYKRWGVTSPSKEYELKKLIGASALDMIIHRFYTATSDEIELILRVYGVEHGQSALSYARKTLPKWKSSVTKLSGQTKERLVRCVPECLDENERYDIAKQICFFYESKRHKKSAHTIINTEEPQEGLSRVYNTIQTFYEARETIELPEDLTQAISWLAKDDVTIARALLAKVEQESASRVEKRAYGDLEVVESFLAKEEQIQINQTIEFPNGIISLSTYTPRKPFLKRLVSSIFGG
jgi:hypothetical protein